MISSKSKMLYVVWVDSQITSFSWTYVNDIEPKIATVESIGFVVAENKETLTLAGSVSVKDDSENQATQIITIPKCSITKKRVISF